MSTRTIAAVAAAAILSASLGGLAWYRWHERDGDHNSSSAPIQADAPASSRYAALTAEQRAIVDKTEDAAQREFLVHVFSVSDIVFKDQGALGPFLAVLRTEPRSAENPVTRADNDRVSRIYNSLMQVSCAWVQAGPFDDLGPDLVASATRFATDPDVTVQSYAYALLLAIQEKPGTTPLPPSAVSAMESLDRNGYVKAAARRWIDMAKKQKADAER